MTWTTINSDNNEKHNNRKLINLSIETCQCRPFKIRSSKGSRVFELTEYGGPRRLWMTSSEHERDLWVLSIKNAMIGCVDEQLGFGYELKLSLALKNIDISLSQYDNTNLHINNHTNNHINNHTNSVNNSQQMKFSSDSSDNNTSLRTIEKPLMSWDGPAAIFAVDIAKYVTIQTAIRDASNSRYYLKIINKLLLKKVEITIPVYYVKVS